MRSYLWLVFSSLIFSSRLFGASECRRLLFPDWIGPAPGYTIIQGLDGCYVYAHDDGSPRAWWQLMAASMETDGGPITYDWIAGGCGMGGFIGFYDYCADSADDGAGPVGSLWGMIGWDDGAGGLTATPPEGATITYGSLMNWDHGIQAAGTGSLCVECGGGAGGGGDITNTNQFHLDVTNALAGIQGSLDDLNGRMTGNVPSGLSVKFRDAALEEWSGLTNSVNEYVADMTNAIGSAPTPGAGTIPDTGEPDLQVMLMDGTAWYPLVWLGGLLAAIETPLSYLRLVILVLLALWVVLTIQREVFEMVAKLLETRSSNPSAGGAIPGLGLAIALALSAIVLTLAFSAPALLAVYSEGAKSILGEQAGVPGLLDGVVDKLIQKLGERVPYGAKFLNLLTACVPIAGILTIIGNWCLYVVIRRPLFALLQTLIRLVPA